MLLPEHCFKPQTMMSSRVWEAELKCSATGNPRDRFRMLRRWSLKRSLVAFQSLRCIDNCSDDKKCNTQHSQTDRWSDHGCYVHSSGLVEKSEKLCACTSGIETVGRALNRHQWETARHQRSVRGYHRGIAHADMIPAEVRGKSCVPWVGGQDVEIVKQDPSGADVEWIIR